ncbi:MAG TPA: hypothetical protein VLE74_01425 [Candidatus Saccharimonadales bacterium]|nr:hypothetical protein [Candidatus Saccharimonadales bacterium]
MNFLDYKNYDSIVQDNLATVLPAGLLRPDISPEHVVQFVQPSGEEYMVVRSTRPYGVMTAAAFNSVSETSDLLEGIYVGEDYSAFTIPNDLLTLRAVSLGTGNHQTEVLQPVYRRLGEMIARTAEKISLPALHLGDIALRRTTGILEFIPPVEFTEGETSLSAVASELSESITHDLAQVFSGSRIAQLNLELMAGLGIRLGI